MKTMLLLMTLSSSGLPVVEGYTFYDTHEQCLEKLNEYLWFTTLWELSTKQPTGYAYECIVVGDE